MYIILLRQLCNLESGLTNNLSTHLDPHTVIQYYWDYIPYVELYIPVVSMFLKNRFHLQKKPTNVFKDALSAVCYP